MAHDNPADQRFHASVTLGFTDAGTLRAFFAGDAVARLSTALPAYVSAVHGYEVSAALTYVRNGVILPAYEE